MYFKKDSIVACNKQNHERKIFKKFNLANNQNANNKIKLNVRKT